MAIFNSYVSLPEGTQSIGSIQFGSTQYWPRRFLSTDLGEVAGDATGAFGVKSRVVHPKKYVHPRNLNIKN
jgi:hypothetical protein